MNKITAFLIFAWITVLIVAAYPNLAKSQGVLCGERSLILETLHNTYGEVVTEQGVDDGLLIVITANTNKKWSFLITPKHKPHTFCVPATGNNWTQEENSSKGITHNGSVLTINYKKNGDWDMIYLDKNTGSIQSVTTGYAWERLVIIK